MSSSFIILPIHLFEKDILLERINDILPDIKTFYILEEPIYFGDRPLTTTSKNNNPDNKLNYNKLKLIYHCATTQYYYDYISPILESHNKIVKHISYDKLSSIKGYNPIKPASSKNNKVYMFDPVDIFVESKYNGIFPKDKLHILETPLFLCSNTDLSQYDKTKKTKTSYFHASFYTWQRSRMDILTGSKTYDTENRNMMPINVKVPSLPSSSPSTTTDSAKQFKKYVDNAIKYVNKTWPHNLEPVYLQKKEKSLESSSILFPITHSATREWVKHFCKMRFQHFGKYEDSIDSVPRNFLFHSGITPMLNIGLITPQEVVNIITDYYNSHKTQIGIANYEGFIRQIIGWREYQRYIYRYAGDKMRSSNHLNNAGILSQQWYNGTTGIKPVDDAIIMAINDGYIHHILRLMVVGNMMNLVGIHPDQVYKWFMEFALDSYDWVMVGNVYSMALWADGGLTMRKPYISGSGYIIKMGNFDSKSKETKEWQNKWDDVFHHFIDRNGEKLLKTYYAGLVKAWGKQPQHNKNDILQNAGDIIKSLTTK